MRLLGLEHIIYNFSALMAEKTSAEAKNKEEKL